MERLGPDAMLILWSAPTHRYSLDVDYEYRQDSNLYYLTGVTQAETMLVLMPGNATRREILFVKDRNPAQEHWTGRLLSADEARERTGIDTVLPSSQFEPFVTPRCSAAAAPARSARRRPRASSTPCRPGAARVGLVLDPNRGVNDPLTPPLEFARQIRDRFVGFQVTDATPILFADLRLVKTPYERKVLVKSFEISNDAQMAGMRAARPGAYEYEVKAAIEAVPSRARRRLRATRPSSAADRTRRSFTIPTARRQMQAGELLLVDAACNYGYMSGDITRTYPVSGTFSPLHRKTSTRSCSRRRRKG